MRTDALHRGDIVLVSKRGRLFHARIAGLGAGGTIAVLPIERDVHHRSVRPDEVVDHWARAARDGDGRPAAGQIAFDLQP